MNRRFNRVVRGVGRITNSAGIPEGRAYNAEFRYRDGLLTKLIRLDALDTLRLFKRGTLTIKNLVAADRVGRLELVAEQLRLDQPLKAAVDAWLPTSARAASSRKRYGVSWSAFWRATAKQLRPDAVVRDLQHLDYHRLFHAWGASESDWNRFRAALSAFLSRYLGAKQHPFRYQILARVPTGREPEGRVPDLDAPAFWTIVKAAPEYVQPAYVALAVLGADTGEYLTLERIHLNKRQLTVALPGTKTRGRPRTVAVDGRLWEWVERAVPAPLQYKWLRTHWLRACRKAGYEGVRLKDLRHLSAQLAGDAGATDRDLATHLGHSNPTMSHRYSRRRVARGVAGRIGDQLAEGA
jgi:integrase